MEYNKKMNITIKDIAEYLNMSEGAFRTFLSKAHIKVSELDSKQLLGVVVNKQVAKFMHTLQKQNYALTCCHIKLNEYKRLCKQQKNYIGQLKYRLKRK